MINKATIKKMARSISYQRGLEIYRDAEWYEFDVNSYVDEWGDEISEIEATVEGSRNNEYDIFITVNESTSEITDSYCACPAFESYEGICKHCVAALLEYMDRRSAVQTEPASEKWLEQFGIKKGKELPKPLKLKRQTNSELKKMLSQYSLRENAVFLPGTMQGQVRLEPCVCCSSQGTVHVRFKIGITHMYVMKNILKFVEDMEEMRTVAYGKRLEFLHCPEAFTEESRPLAKFLMGLKDMKSYRYYSAYHIIYTGDAKELELEGKYLDEFMSVMENQSFLMEFEIGWNQVKSESYRICQGKPEELLRITGDEDGIAIRSELKDRIFGQNYVYYVVSKSVSEGEDEGVLYKEKLTKSEEFSEFMEYLYQSRRATVFIGQEELPVFCRTLLPALEKKYRIQCENFQPEQYLPMEVNFEIYLDAPQKDMIVCKLLGCYGDKKYNLFQSDGTEAGEQGRDIRRERQAKSQVGQYFYAYDAASEGMAMQGEEEIYRFLTKGMDTLKELGEVFVSEELKKIRMVHKVKIQVGVSLSGNLLQMQISSEQFTREQLAEILSRYEKKKKYYRLKTGEFVRMDEEGIQVLDDLRENFQLTDKQMSQEEISLPKYRALYLDGRLKGEGFQVKKSREFKQLIRDMKTVEDNDFELPESLSDILREYQKMGFLWMKTLCRAQFGGILADDMGLGKTLQTIAFLLSEYQEAGKKKRRALIVTPASLVYNWKSEFEKFAPELCVYTVTGNAKEREELLSHLEDRVVLITSYQLLYRDEELYEKIRFDYQIIDEAQMIKNQGNQTTKAVKEISASFRMALTGTPVENQLSELWSIFDFVMPGFLYKYQRFRKEIETPIVKSQDEERMKRLQRMIQPFILRRTKQEVLKELPDKIEKCMYARMEGEQRKLYNAHAQRLQMQLARQSDEEFKTSKIRILAELTRLRQLCCDPSLFYQGYQDGSAKLELCMDLIGNAVESGHKMLLFSQFTGMLDNITERLREKKISYYLLTGKTSKEERIRMANRFNVDDTSVFCISLKAGGTGLNLIGADMVIHYDPWWNAAVETQATDRAHRIGQKQSVTVYKLIAKSTIEEKIVELQSRKKELASQVLGGEGIGQISFSKEDLLELLDTEE